MILLAAVVITIFGAVVYFIAGGGRIMPEMPAEIEVVEESAETAAAGKPKGTLKAFRSATELNAYLRRYIAKPRRQPMPASKNSIPTPQASPSMAADSTVKSEAKESSSSGDDESVTNVQHAGVDEGGIVKLHKDHLVILRRGRLFTVAIGDDSLRPVSKVDAFAPDVDPEDTWYDEMLISNNTIAVIGYSYDRGGTEIGLFSINDAGKLKYRSTYHLRSNDYYSSRNYASRLVGGKLVFYTPQYLSIDGANPTADFPALRKWRKGAKEAEFMPVVAPTRTYRPVYDDFESGSGKALHTVTTCNLESEDFSCSATAVVGPAGRVFYVSPNSVYVWTSDWRQRAANKRNNSMLYRMPLDGSAPSAIAAAGSPVDQFSFLESADGFLNVLVQADGGGDGMWRAETTEGDVALMRVAVERFSNGLEAVPAANYRALPKPDDETVQNRFVGDYLLYGAGNSWDRAKTKDRANLFSVRWKTGEIDEVSLKHSVDRIEALGDDAVVVGSNGTDLYFSAIDLGVTPRFHASFVRKNAAQGETRSHGFFYKAENSESGLLGLPIRGGGSAGYESLHSDSASILFLRNDSLNLSEIGELGARSGDEDDDESDGCRASCVDWYGNARPLFVRGRVFGLLGYEIVEGTVTGGRIKEKRRISFSPASRNSNAE